MNCVIGYRRVCFDFIIILLFLVINAKTRPNVMCLRHIGEKAAQHFSFYLMLIESVRASARVCVMAIRLASNLT